MKKMCVLPILILFLVAEFAVAANIFVSTHGSDSTGVGTLAQPYSTIQKGVDISQDGDTVYVASGTYTGPGNRDIDLRGRRITLRSISGELSTTIDLGGHKGFSATSTENLDTIISGFTIKNGYAIASHDWAGVGIVDIWDPAGLTIKNCIFTQNEVSTGYTTTSAAIINKVETEGEVHVENVLFYNNICRGGKWAGPYFTHVVGMSGADFLAGRKPLADTMVINHCTIANNRLLPNGTAPGGVSVLITGSISNTIVWGNDIGTNHNVFADRSIAYLLHDGTLWGDLVDGTIMSSDPLFIDAAQDNFRLAVDSPARNNGDPNSVPNTDGSRADIGYRYSTSFDTERGPIPIIELNGANPLHIFKGEVFTDPGALVTDDVDETRTINGSGTVDTTTVGTYTLTYEATDTDGNNAQSVTRTVNVVLNPAGDEDNDGVTNYRETADGTDINDPNSFNPLSKGLVAYYPLDGNGNDESGYGRHGTVYGGTFEEGRRCTEALAFNTLLTTSNKITTPVNVNQSTKWTFSSWFRTTVGGTVIGNDLNDQNLVLAVHTLGSGGEGKGQLKFGIFAEGLGVQIQTADRYDDGQWHHVTGVFDGTVGNPISSQFSVYVDGSKVTHLISGGNTGNESIFVPLPSGEITIGFNRKEVSGIYNIPSQITLQDVRIYDRALSEGEAKRIYFQEALTYTQKQFVYSNPELLGHYSLAQYNANRTNGQIDVTTNPSAFNLFTQQQFDSNRTAGQSDVINNPMSYGLYTSDSIMDLRMGGLMIQRQGTNAVVSFQPQTTTDLTQPFTNNGTPITNEISMPGNKGFIRINAKP